jgi:hypothetical protein
MEVSERDLVMMKADLSEDSESLIHLAYGLQLSSRTMAIEALAMACCSPSNALLELALAEDNGKASFMTSSASEILDKMAHDDRFKIGINDHVLLDYWKALDLTNNLHKQFKELQELAVKLGLTYQDSSLLRSFHAVRGLLPLIPSQFHIILIREWWLTALSEFVSQGRKHGSISDDMGGTLSWKRIEQLAKSHLLDDANCLGNLVSLKYAEETWSSGPESVYLKAAYMLVNQRVPESTDTHGA